MAVSAWIAGATDLLRKRPGLVASAAGAILAFVIAAWWTRPRPLEVPPQRVAADYSEVALRNLPVPAPVPAPPAADPAEPCGPASSAAGAGEDLAANMAAADAALGRLAADLAARSTARERVLGLYLEMVAPPDGPLDDSQVRERLGELVRLATTTSDASAYAMAVYTCTPPRVAAYQECGLVSYQQWARLDPDNAVPWLYLAGQAERHLDLRAMESALVQASKAKFSDAHLDQISGLFAAEPTASIGPGVQFDLAGSLYSIQGGLPHPPLTTFAHYCGEEMQLYPDRVKTCGDLAATLIEHGHTPIEVLAASRVAERIGWTDPRLARLRDQSDAMRWQIFGAGQAPNYLSLHGCDSLKRLRDYMIVNGEVGEVRQLREALANEGISTAQAAQRWRSAQGRR